MLAGVVLLGVSTTGLMTERSAGMTLPAVFIMSLGAGLALARGVEPDRRRRFRQSAASGLQRARRERCRGLG